MTQMVGKIVRRSARGVASALCLTGAAWAGYWGALAPYPIPSQIRLRLLLATFGLGATGVVLAVDTVRSEKASTKDGE